MALKLKETKPNAPPVEEPKPIPEQIENNPATSEDVQTQQTQEEVATPSLFDLSQFPKEKIAMAEDLGIPITAIANTMNGWAMSVEARFNVLANAVTENPKKTIELLKQEANAARKQYQKQNPQATQQPQAGSMGGLGDILAILKETGVMGGSQSNPMMETFMTAAMQNAMESMSYGTAFMKSIFTKMAPEFANEIATKMLPKVVPAK